LARYQLQQTLTPLDGRKQSIVIAEFVSLLVESACLFLQIADPLVLMNAAWGKHGGRVGEMLGSFRITQSGECNVAATGRRFGLVHSKAVMSAPLLCLNIREQSIRLCQFPRFDGFLRISFQGSDVWGVAGLSRRRFPKGFEVLCDFDKLGSQPLRGNVLLTDDTQSGTHLTLVEVQFLLKQNDVLSLLCGEFLQRAFRIANKLVNLFLWNADNNRRASDTAADSNAAGIRPDLSKDSGNRREEETHAQCCDKEQMPLHGGGSPPPVTHHTQPCPRQRVLGEAGSC